MSDTFKFVENGSEIELTIRKPTRQDFQKAQAIYHTAFYEACQNRAMLRMKLDDFAREQKIWDDEKDAKYKGLQKELLEYEKTLLKGGIKLLDAKNIALKMIKIRDEMRQLIIWRAQLDNNTAEGCADNAKFNYLVSVCLVYKSDGKPYFANYEDFLNKDNSIAAIWGGQRLSKMLYGLEDNFESRLPEYKFLKKFNFVDDKLRFIDKKGHLIDEEGRLINEDGRFIDEDGNLVDKDKNPVDISGNYIIDNKPFLDDNGNPIKELNNEKSDVSVDT